MNENIDLTKILKDVPEGTKLYSPLFGEVKLIKVSVTECEYPIITNEGDFVSDGRYYIDHKDGECMLFPSKDQRDWSKFEVQKKKVKVTLHPFDKVLVRDDVTQDWRCSILTYIFADATYKYRTLTCVYMKCLPYIAKTAHLLGTTETPSVEYEIEFDKSFKEE